MRDVYVAGVGQTEFGVSQRGVTELGAKAIHAALGDAHLEKGDIDAAYVGNVGGPADAQQLIVGQATLREAGIDGISIVNMENACSSSSHAFREAYRAVAAGFEDVALVLGVEKMRGETTEMNVTDIGGGTDAELEGKRGLTTHGLYAMRTRAYKSKYDADNLREALAEIAVKNHRNGASNPYAHFQNRITTDDVFESRLIANPLRLYDFCPRSDGAAAAIVASDEFVDGDDVSIDASVHVTGQYDERTQELSRLEGVARAAEIAYDQAGVAGANEIDVFSVHDACTIGELQTTEALGISDYGEAPTTILNGKTAHDGGSPVNPGGGLKARGHPLGATGVAQINELVWQLRGEANKRQIPDASRALAENAGGTLNGESANTTIHILGV